MAARRHPAATCDLTSPTCAAKVRSRQRRKNSVPRTRRPAQATQIQPLAAAIAECRRPLPRGLRESDFAREPAPSQCAAASSVPSAHTTNLPAHFRLSPARSAWRSRLERPRHGRASTRLPAIALRAPRRSRLGESRSGTAAPKAFVVDKARPHAGPCRSFRPRASPSMVRHSLPEAESNRAARGSDADARRSQGGLILSARRRKAPSASADHKPMRSAGLPCQRLTDMSHQSSILNVADRHDYRLPAAIERQSWATGLTCTATLARPDTSYIGRQLLPSRQRAATGDTRRRPTASPHSIYR